MGAKQSTQNSNVTYSTETRNVCYPVTTVTAHQKKIQEQKDQLNQWQRWWKSNGGQSDTKLPWQSQPPKPKTPSICDVRKTELNQIQSDAQKKQQEIDNCDPQQAQQRKVERALAENREFVRLKTEEMNSEITRQSEVQYVAQSLYDVSVPLKQYLTNLTDQKNSLNTKLSTIQQNIRKNRRRFLDNEPQSGVQTIFGLNTSDDKIMLGFWITYMTAIVAAAFVLTNVYSLEWGLDTTQKRSAIIFIIVGILYGIAYYAITKYA